MNNFRKSASIVTALMVLFIFVQIIAGSAPGRKAGASDAHDISSEQIVSGATTTFF
ncbi:hypothetical protein [Lacticaseibacillus sharpeae]|nr:hypothetical protein [Lacticaseibacillus sharpeae]